MRYLLVLVLSVSVFGCIEDMDPEVVTLAPSAFSDSGVWSGEPWSVALAALPDDACEVHVHLVAPNGDGTTIAVQRYGIDAPLGRYLDEREGICTEGVYRLMVPQDREEGPIDLVAINQSGGRDHYIFGATVTICR